MRVCVYKAPIQTAPVKTLGSLHIERGFVKPLGASLSPYTEGALQYHWGFHTYIYTHISIFLLTDTGGAS